MVGWIDPVDAMEIKLKCTHTHVFFIRHFSGTSVMMALQILPGKGKGTGAPGALTLGGWWSMYKIDIVRRTCVDGTGDQRVFFNICIYKHYTNAGIAVANASFRTIALGEIEDRGPDLKALESVIVQVRFAK